MSKVRILPEVLSNKIAAGEVVERPASVVKELVENSLDAKSTSITVEVEKGGRSMIRVSDNGSGMAADDALLAIERYATSKLVHDDDLFSINTLGFRGEALPSIASVSKFNLISRPGDSDTAVCVDIKGGTVKGVSETGAPPGTMITVSDLFFNTPVRRKFLKAMGTEMGHIADTVSSIALGWPNVMFRLIHNKSTIKSFASSSSTYDRAVDVLGKDLQNELYDISYDDAYMTLKGLVSSANVTRSTSRKVYLYVNGRYIRDRGLLHALYDGYGHRLMKGRFPVAVLFLDLPFDQVDVNVHPTKHEVRFADQKRIYNALKETVSQRHKKEERAKWLSIKEKQEAAIVKTGAEPAQTEAVQTEPRQIEPKQTENDRFTTSLEPVRESIPNRIQKQDQPKQPRQSLTRDDSVQEENQAFASEMVAVEDVSNDRIQAEAVLSGKDRFIAQTSQEQLKNKKPLQEEIWEQGFFESLTVLGQLSNTYLLCESGEGLIIIDQHAAHERIVYEALKKKGVKNSSQNLLLPETIELGHKEAQALLPVLPELLALGLEVEPFGETTVVIKAYPTLLAEEKIASMVMDMAEKLVDIGTATDMTDAIDECLILMSCHGAIRANMALNDTQISHLLKQMDACENGSFCPHGRPTWIKWSKSTIEKAFKRIG